MENLGEQEKKSPGSIGRNWPEHRVKGYLALQRFQGARSRLSIVSISLGQGIRTGDRYATHRSPALDTDLGSLVFSVIPSPSSISISLILCSWSPAIHKSIRPIGVQISNIRKLELCTTKRCKAHSVVVESGLLLSTMLARDSSGPFLDTTELFSWMFLFP